MGMIDLVDIYGITPDPDYTKLNIKQRHRLMDQVFNASDESQRGLLVGIEQSSSGRPINGRLYLPKAQQASLEDWTKPFQKPIYLNHKREGEVLGRVKTVDWTPIDAYALAFFNNDRKAYNMFKRTLDKGNAKEIYDALSSYGLISNRDWRGTGILESKLFITLPDAVEKFLRGEYLTFSSGAQTDSMTCGKCGTPIGECAHYPGGMTDNTPDIFICGGYFPKEVSVTPDPAYVYSMVKSMAMQDSQIDLPNYSTTLDESLITVVDSFIYLPTTQEEAEMNIQELVDALVPVLKEQLKPEESTPKAIPWKVLDLALKGAGGTVADCIPERKLGPDGYFAIPDVKTLDIALSILTDFDSNIQDELRPKLDALRTGFIQVADEELSSLKADYATALAQLQDIRKELEDATILTAELTQANDSLKSELDKLKITSQSRVTSEVNESDPSAANQSSEKLSDYERKIVARYKEIKDTSGDSAADIYLADKRRRGQISKSFNIKQFTTGE